MGIVNQVLGFFGFGSSESPKSEGVVKTKAAPRPRRSSDMSEDLAGLLTCQRS